MSLLSSPWQDAINPYLPSSSGRAMFAPAQDTATLSPDTGLLVFLGWTAVAPAALATPDPPGKGTVGRGQ